MLAAAGTTTIAGIGMNMIRKSMWNKVKKNLKDSLAGRKIIFHMHPLSFYEFLIFKNQGDLAKLLLTETFLK